MQFSIFAGDLAKSPESVPDVEFADFKVGSSAERYRTRMAEGFPKPLRALHRSGGTRASDCFASDNAAIDVVKRHDHEMGNFAQMPFLPLRTRLGTLVFLLGLSTARRPFVDSRQ